jgi:hypothetical protein
MLLAMVFLIDPKITPVVMRLSFPQKIYYSIALFLLCSGLAGTFWVFGRSQVLPPEWEAMHNAKCPGKEYAPIQLEDAFFFCGVILSGGICLSIMVLHISHLRLTS